MSAAGDQRRTAAGRGEERTGEERRGEERVEERGESQPRETPV
jgi:hypothetical protein